MSFLWVWLGARVSSCVVGLLVKQHGDFLGLELVNSARGVNPFHNNSWLLEFRDDSRQLANMRVSDTET